MILAIFSVVLPRGMPASHPAVPGSESCLCSRPSFLLMLWGAAEDDGSDLCVLAAHMGNTQTAVTGLSGRNQKIQDLPLHHRALQISKQILKTE